MEMMVNDRHDFSCSSQTTRAEDYLPSFTLIILIIIIVAQWIPNMTAGREVADCNVQSLATENTTMVSSTKATMKFLILGAHIANNHSGKKSVTESRKY